MKGGMLVQVLNPGVPELFSGKGQRSRLCLKNHNSGGRPAVKSERKANKGPGKRTKKRRDAGT